METLKNIYLRALEGVGEMPSWKKDWRWVAVYSLCIYAIVLAFRLSFAGRWDHPELWVNGERILATHDAYFWLAKAKGVGLLEGYPVAQLASCLNKLGFGYGSIGFWTPAFMGALVGVVCYLWGWLIAGRSAGLMAGLIGSLTPGFFYRSRLGYYDTDMFTLLMPMIVAWMLAYWASRQTKGRWFGEDDLDSSRGSVWLAFVTGLTARFAGWWHDDIVNVLVLYTFGAVVFVLINGRDGKRASAFYDLCVFILAAFPGAYYGIMQLWPLSYITPVLNVDSVAMVFSFVGIALSFALACFQFFYSRNFAALQNPFIGFVCLIYLILATNLVFLPFGQITAKIVSYFSSGGETLNSVNPTTHGPIYPSIIQSIIEAKKTALSVVLERGAFASWIGYIALFSGVIIVILRPVAAFLLPLVFLHVLSVNLGVRFSMFGGATLMIFCGVAIHWCVQSITKNIKQNKSIAFVIQSIVASALLIYCYNSYSQIPLTPVIPKQHAEALIECGDMSQKDAVLWTWWDWGYASQYYAGLQTVIDGGKHAGRDVYPVAFAMSTADPEKSRSMVSYSSQFPSGSLFELGYSPAVSWDKIPRESITESINQQLARSDYQFTSPQYFVVTWKDLTISKWITYFGNWNLQKGSTRAASINNFDPGQLGFNIQQGAVMNRKGGGGLVSDITILDNGIAETTEYYMNKLSPRLLPKKRHLVINKVSRQSVLMDRIAYRSMMTRLLIGDPNDPEITPYFKLVVDKLPFARIYEVIQ